MIFLQFIKRIVWKIINIFSPFENYTVSYYFSRFGNNLQQIANGIIYVNIKGKNLFISSHPFVTNFKIINRKSHSYFSIFKKKYRFFYLDDKDFPGKSIDKSIVNKEIQNVFQNEIKNNIPFIKDQSISEDTLVIHIRSGDIFSNFKSDYYQNPINYYQALIKKYEKILLVTSEEQNNPVIKVLKKYNNIKIQSTSIENDFNTIYNATNLATSGVGTFPIAAALMSKNLKNLYYSNLYLEEHLNPSMISKNKIKHYKFCIDESYKNQYSFSKDLESLLLDKSIIVSTPENF